MSTTTTETDTARAGEPDASAEPGVKLERPVTVDEQRHALLYSFVAGPILALGLTKRVPELARRLGWPDDLDSHAVIAAAVGACKLGADGQRFRIPLALTAECPDWRRLANRYNGAPPAEAILAEFEELQRLLEPA